MSGAGGAVLACDVGGTKLAAALIDADGRLVGRGRIVRTPSGPGADAEALFATLLVLARETLADLPPGPAGAGPAVLGVGVGCGGPMSWPAGRVSPLNMPGWRDFPLRERLAERLQLAVRVHNDAVCMALGEHWRGAGRNGGDLLGMVVSTGVGAGIVSGGRLIEGATGNAGHLGHVVVDPAGPPCTCGGRGCLEAVASGPSIAAWAHANGWR
ncbi:MAG: ROK family protein, partial [Actinomycetota bacterium]|nr:ROK family protein [Actinomycetota bacterium]